MNKQRGTIRIGIAGANGYTGGELLKLLARHPYAEVTYVTSRSDAGKKVAEVFPALTGYGSLEFKEFSVSAAAELCDVMFLCLPHTAGAAIAEGLINSGIKVIDLSANFRYKDVNLYEKTYNVTHPAPELNKTAVYGLPELNRAEIKNAALAANPGCYTTCSILSLYPLLAEKLIKPAGIIINAASGVSGAGRRAEAEYAFCEVSDNFKAYSVTTHRHTSEIEAVLSQKAAASVTVNFTPHLSPVKRGILCTIYAPVTDKFKSESDAEAAYLKYYKGEKFVHYTGTALPELKHVTETNNCKIGCKYDPKNGLLIIVSALDNLIKGASGQAVQNMNVMFGMPEKTGL